MPTYALLCTACNEQYEQWASIHDDTPLVHSCGATAVKVYNRVNTYAVGPRGAHTKRSDTLDAQWTKDMGAYKRLRGDGHQPISIDGADRTEAVATDDWYIKSGGLVRVPDDRKQEINEMLALGKMNPDGWSPVDQVKTNREIAKKS